MKTCIIADGEFLPRTQILRHIQNKTTIALDGAFNKLIKLNITPDVILGDFDSIDKNLIPEKITCIHTPDQNHTDLEKGIHYAIANNATQIDIICALGGRLDHSIFNLHKLRQFPNHKIILHNEVQSVRFIKNNSITIYGKPGDYCGVLALPKAKINSRGLKYEASDYEIELGFKESVANQLLARQAQVRVDGEALVVMPVV